MFDRQRAYDMRAWHISRYNSMMESTHPEDKANAEACRLATQAWQDIAQNMQNPEAEEFDVEQVISEIRYKWNEYCKTGIPRYDVQELADEARQAFFVELAEKRRRAARQSGESNSGLQDSADSAKGSQKKKPAKSNPSGSMSIAVPGQSAVATVIDESVRALINPDSIEAVIQEIYDELGIDKQVIEQESSIRVHDQ